MKIVRSDCKTLQCNESMQCIDVERKYKTVRKNSVMTIIFLQGGYNLELYTMNVPFYVHRSMP